VDHWAHRFVIAGLLTWLPVVALASPPAGGPGETDASAPSEALLVGRVQSVDGEPLAGVRLIQIPTPMPDPSDPRFQEIQTERPQDCTKSDGTFAIPLRIDGSGTILASAPDWSPNTAFFSTMLNREGPIDAGTIILPPARVVEGRVVDEAGAPVAEVEVRSSSSYPLATFRPLAERDGRTEVTGPDGGFRFGGLSSISTLVLVASKPGYLPEVVESRRTPKPQPVEIVLVEAASVAGRVLDPTGKPVAGAVVLSSSREPRPPFPPAVTDADGRFEIPRARPGGLWLTAQAEGYVSAGTEHFRVRAGERKEGVVLRLEAPLTFRGRLVDLDGVPVRRALVRTASGGQAVRTDRDGAFEIGGLRGQLGSLEIDLEGWPPFTWPVAVDRFSRERRTVEIPLGEIHGRVLQSDGSAAVGVPLEVEAAEHHVRHTGPGALVVSGEDGSFRVPRLPPGIYRFRVTSHGSSWTWSRWPVPDLVEVGGSLNPRTTPVAQVEVRLPWLTTVDLRLVHPAADDEAPPDHGAMLALVGTEDFGIVQQKLLVEGPVDDLYRLGSMPPGVWLVLVLGEGAGPVAGGTFVVEGGSREQVVEVPLGASGEVFERMERQLRELGLAPRALRARPPG